LVQPDIMKMTTSERGLIGIVMTAAVWIIARAYNHKSGRWDGHIHLFTAIIVVVGLFLTISGPYQHTQSANERRCEALQKDMLSARPRRADAPALFQALACHPRGDGSVYAPLRHVTSVQ
jgi:hypothetical protein